MWYVIQTLASKEEKVKKFIESVTPPELYEDIRIVYHEIQRKYQGSWHTERKRMFPGYLFVITEDAEALHPYLRKGLDPARLLRVDGKPAPLMPWEQKFLEQLTGEGEVVPMSIGIQEGDKVFVREGFLKGIESRIRRIDRHKRRAWIEVDILGESRLAEVGLEIVEKRE